MKSLLRRGLICFLGGIFAVVLAMGLGTVVPRPLPFGEGESAGAPVQETDRRQVLILSNPIHTDIALPADPDVLETFGFVSENGLKLDHPGVFWIMFGWGGRSFYIETPTWGHLRVGPVIDAFTWDASVMHVRRAGDIPQTLDAVTTLELGQTEFDHLLSGIRESFDQADDSGPVPIAGSSYDAHDIFFPAKGGFNALLGCNTWTARMLREAGLKTGAWTPLPVTLTWSISLHNSL